MCILWRVLRRSWCHFDGALLFELCGEHECSLRQGESRSTRVAGQAVRVQQSVATGSAHLERVCDGEKPVGGDGDDEPGRHVQRDEEDEHRRLADGAAHVQKLRPCSDTGTGYHVTLQGSRAVRGLFRFAP